MDCRKIAITGYILTAIGLLLYLVNIAFAVFSIVGFILMGYGWYKIGDLKEIYAAKINGALITLMIILSVCTGVLAGITLNFAIIGYFLWISIIITTIIVLLNIKAHLDLSRKTNVKLFKYSAYLRIVSFCISISGIIYLIRKLSSIKMVDIYALTTILKSFGGLLISLGFLVYGAAYIMTIYGLYSMKL